MSDIHGQLVSYSSPEQLSIRTHTRSPLSESSSRVSLFFTVEFVELPDLEAFEPTYEEAYNFIIDGIRNSKSRPSMSKEGSSPPLCLTRLRNSAVA